MHAEEQQGLSCPSWPQRSSFVVSGRQHFAWPGAEGGLALPDQALIRALLLPDQALKEVYLPECGVWVADYPFLDRGPFLDLSLEIERERQAQREAAPL
jgi:hypothetical protein